MKLYLLRPSYNYPDDYDPWEPWYDKYFGFVIRAKNESEARKLARDERGDENRGKISPWLDPVYSTCVELKKTGDAEVIIKDFARA